MNQTFHVYRQKKSLKNGTAYRWYYYHYENGKKIQKSCQGCETKEEAEAFIQSLSPPQPRPAGSICPISQVTRSMFLAGSHHLSRRKQLGRSVNPETMRESKHYADVISSLWGNTDIRDLSATEVMKYLFESPKSGKWKNRFIEILNEIYFEAKWHGASPQKLELPRFAAQSKKADILSPAELSTLLQPANFPTQELYLLFLTSFSAGLRLGEARAILSKQFVPEKQILIIDGFCKKDGTRTAFCKKGSPEEPKTRIVCLPTQTASILASHVSANSLRPEDWMFPAAGKPIRQEAAENAFYSALQHTGLIPKKQPLPRMKNGEGRRAQSKARQKSADGRKLVPHSLRYTYISMMLQHAASQDLRPMTGHASTAMVDYYNRTVLDMSISALAPSLRRAAESIAEWMR